MDFMLALSALVLLSTLWIMLLVAVDACLFVYRKLHPPVVVSCPRNGAFAAVNLHGGDRPQVMRCSRWPEYAGCAQDCLRAGRLAPPSETSASHRTPHHPCEQRFDAVESTPTCRR